MTKALLRFLKLRSRIETGKNDIMEMYNFVQSLDAVQARELINDVYRHTTTKDEAMNFCDTLIPMLREEVAIELIRETLQYFSDKGFGSLEYDKDGNIDAIHINSEQSERLIAYQKAMKGSEA